LRCNFHSFGTFGGTASHIDTNVNAAPAVNHGRYSTEASSRMLWLMNAAGEAAAAAGGTREAAAASSFSSLSNLRMPMFVRNMQGLDVTHHPWVRVGSENQDKQQESQSRAKVAFKNTILVEQGSDFNQEAAT